MKNFINKAGPIAGIVGFLLALVLLAVTVVVPAESPVDRTYGCDVYMEQGCAKFIVASGGEIEVQSGGTLDVQSGATFTSYGQTINGNLTVTGTSDLQGNVSDSGGTFTIVDNVSITGTSDLQGNVSDSGGDFTIADNAVVTGTSDLQGNVSNSTGDLVLADNVDITGVANLAVGTEHIGALTIISRPITYTAGAGTSGVLATIGDGEIWIVYDVFIRTTTTFTDTAGNDETFIIGDDLDTDGFLSATTTELDSTFTEATGYPAGWYGLENGSNGAYTVDEGIFVYAPSGSSQTIDYVLASGAGDDIGAGALTMYLVYMRFQ